MSIRLVCLGILIIGLVACRNDPANPISVRVPAPSISGADYALRSVAGESLPQPTVLADEAPLYVADTIRFDIAYAANVPGPLALTRTVYRELDGGTDTVVVIVRYIQEDDHLTFPPVCVPSENCPVRFLEGHLDGRWLTLDVPAPLRGPLRYERVE